jgi:hypothetical protein
VDNVDNSVDNSYFEGFSGDNPVEYVYLVYNKWDHQEKAGIVRQDLGTITATDRVTFADTSLIF